MMAGSSKIKKTSAALLVAANAVGLVNSGLLTHDIYQKDALYKREAPGPLSLFLIAPVLTFTPWALEKHERAPEHFDHLPVPFIADQIGKVLPGPLHKTVGVAFSFASAPGAYAGTVVGMSTGIATKYAKGIGEVLTERTARLQKPTP